MGDYSIAKSFKGILRIAHIKDMGDNMDEYAIDELLNPSFYGTPSELIDLSGKETSSTTAGYSNAIKALSGGLKRYNRFALDKLRLNRVPVTDSMGNYINWNVGFDGLTIGSNESINGYDPSTITVNDVTYQRLFPVLKTNNITVGMKKMLLGINKGAVNKGHVDLESYTQSPLLVVQNSYDKSDVNKTFVGEKSYDNEIFEEGVIQKPDKVSKYFKYNESSSNDITDFRTVYMNTKHTVEDYDVFMYNQDNFDTIDGIHYSKVDIINLKKYVKKLIDKFMKGNVVEVPSGMVIWQYCSLDKWRAESETAYGNSINLENKTGFPGHRPSMQMRENQTKDSANPFFDTLVQGACRKQTYLSGPTQLSSTQKETSDDSAMSIKEDDKTLLSEIIPLYKRDYVLCDGSVYRIPYLPIGFSSNLSDLMINRSRFFELFFNLGYKYTSKDKMLSRHLSERDVNGSYYLVNDDGKKITDNLSLLTDYNKNDTILQSLKSFTKLSSGRKTNLWSGIGTPKFVDVTNEVFNNCDDLDVLFQEDLATMLCCDEIYRFVREKENQSVTQTPTRDEIINHLKNTNLPETYIFNSYIGDTSNDIIRYGSKSSPSNNLKLDVIEITYHGATGLTDDGTKPTLLLGREVTTFGSIMKFYDTTQKTFVNVRVYELPLVTYFIQLITSSKGVDAPLVPFLYTFFNYDFQVPQFIANDRTPSFIGSSAYLYSNNYMKGNNKVQSWSCTYDCSFMPHRHYIALSKYEKKNESITDDNCYPYIYHGYNLHPVWGESANASPYYSSTELSSSNSTLAEVCRGVTDICKGNKHGWGKTAMDGTGSYIFRDIEVSLESLIRNGVPVLIAQSKNNEIPDITTGIDYTINDEVKLNENFTYSDGDYKGYYEYHKDKWFSFQMGKDDPRFENAEPNRGISSTKTGIGFGFDDQKTSKNITNFPNTTSTTFFSMENVTMLPLIKL